MYGGVMDSQIFIPNYCFVRTFHRCVYERAPFAPTLMTFALSAWWHGFYPGYYMGFIYMAILIEASRKVRAYGAGLLFFYYGGKKPNEGLQCILLKCNP